MTEIPMKLYFLVEVVPAQQDSELDEDFPNGTWMGVPFDSEADYMKRLRDDVKQDILSMPDGEFLGGEIRIVSEWVGQAVVKYVTEYDPRSQMPEEEVST